MRARRIGHPAIGQRHRVAEEGAQAIEVGGGIDRPVDARQLRLPGDEISRVGQHLQERGRPAGGEEGRRAGLLHRHVDPEHRRIPGPHQTQDLAQGVHHGDGDPRLRPGRAADLGPRPVGHRQARAQHALHLLAREGGAARRRVGAGARKVADHVVRVHQHEGVLTGIDPLVVGTDPGDRLPEHRPRTDDAVEVSLHGDHRAGRRGDGVQGWGLGGGLRQLGEVDVREAQGLAVGRDPIGPPVGRRAEAEGGRVGDRLVDVRVAADDAAIEPVDPVGDGPHAAHRDTALVEREPAWIGRQAERRALGPRAGVGAAPGLHHVRAGQLADLHTEQRPRGRQPLARVEVLLHDLGGGAGGERLRLRRQIRAGDRLGDGRLIVQVGHRHRGQRQEDPLQAAGDRGVPAAVDPRGDHHRPLA